MNTKKPIILIDGSSYLFRAYYALPPLTNKAGEPTGAIYGVINMLKKLLADYNPEHCCVVFDAKGKTFRHKLFSDYKANRGAMPEELALQIEPLHEIVKALGFPFLQVSGVEADDVIATLAKQAADKQQTVLISTGDKDFAQCVNEHVQLINTMTGEKLDIAGVEKKFGILPSQVVDYLSLIGDKVDNIPGITKVGPKTAVKWLSAYGNLAGVIEHADEIKGKVGENLRDELSHLELNQKLVTILQDVPLSLTIDDLSFKAPNVDRLAHYYKRFGFNNWLYEVEKMSATTDTPSSSAPSLDYELVLTQEALQEWETQCLNAKQVAFDCETTSLNIIDAQLVGVSLCTEPNKAAYIPILHNYDGAPKQLSQTHVLTTVKKILANSECIKIAHNLKYDLNILAQAGVKVDSPMADTMLQAYVLSSHGRHDLDTLAQTVLDKQTIHFEDVAGKGAKQITFDKVHLDQAMPYACEDVDIALQLKNNFSNQLEQNEQALNLYNTIELPLVPVLAAMERKGVKVDKALLAEQSQQLGKRLHALQESIFCQAGESFNIDSPKQLQAILYDKLGLPVLAKTPKGQPSTAEGVLVDLAVQHELPATLLEYRSLNKLKTTYVDKLPLQINQTTGRIHASFHQTGTSTGRLSSSNPNLQNIPIRSESGKKIREAFIADNNMTLLAVDYSQIELRIMAHLSADKTLVKAFNENADIHSITASEVFDVPLNAVSEEQRRRAKAINFGLIYGMSAFGLSKQIGVSREEANDYINVYFSRYPGVKDYMDSTRNIAKEKGYVETLFGRRLYLPDIHAKRRMQQQAAERAAINAPMQGTAADLIKLAMIKSYAWLQNESPSASLIIQVHDELVFEIPSRESETLMQGIIHIMQTIHPLKVPLLVSAGLGKNWNQAH